MRKTILLIPAFGLLTACVNLNAPLSASHGVASLANLEAQAVSLEPAKGAPQPDPVLTAAAIRRYQNDEVKTGEDEAQPMIELNLSPTP